MILSVRSIENSLSPPDNLYNLVHMLFLQEMNNDTFETVACEWEPAMQFETNVNAKFAFDIVQNLPGVFVKVNYIFENDFQALGMCTTPPPLSNGICKNSFLRFIISDAYLYTFK